MKDREAKVRQTADTFVSYEHVGLVNSFKKRFSSGVGRTHSFDVLVCDGRIKCVQIFYSINDLTHLFHTVLKRIVLPDKLTYRSKSIMVGVLF